MSDLVWWVLFVFLTLLLISITLKLCYRILTDCFCDDGDPYSEDYKDIEDLTRYRTDFRTILKGVEVEDASDKLVMTKEFINNRKNEENKTIIAIEEEEEEKPEIPAGKIDEVIAPNVEEIDGKIKKEDEYNDLTEAERIIYEQILGIEGEVDIYAKQIPYCLGGKHHLQYFELNQKFLMNLIGLSGIDCSSSDKLKRRKHVVSTYIKECQEKLKKKADEKFYSE